MNVHPLPLEESRRIAEGTSRIVEAMLASPGCSLKPSEVPEIVREVSKSLATAYAAAALGMHAPSAMALPAVPEAAPSAQPAPAVKPKAKAKAKAKDAPKLKPFAKGKPVPPAQPVVDPAQSVRHDALVCLADGSERPMLKRYLKAKYGMSWQQYLDLYGLPGHYPSIAPAIRERRSRKAKAQGLGSTVDKTPRTARAA